MLEFMLSKAETRKKLTDLYNFDLETTPCSLQFSVLNVWTEFTYRAGMMYSVFRWEKSASSKFQNIPIRGKEPWMTELSWGLFERNLLWFLSISHYFGTWVPYKTVKKQYLVPLSLKVSPDARKKPVLRKHVNSWGSEWSERAGNDVYLVHCFTWSPNFSYHSNVW